jgi:hypothetical protein
MRPGPAARPTRAPPGQRLGGILDAFRVCTASQDAAHFPRRLSGRLDELGQGAQLSALRIKICRRQPLLVGTL